SQLLFGDNHDVRTLPGKTQAAGIGTAPACDLGRKTLRRPIDGVVRDTIGETFENWWAANARLTAPIATSIPGNHPPLTAPPFIMVATAGGASRAAFWTSQVLGEIARREADFAERVFMISGVSGGSLGATTFRSIVEADRRAGADGVILRQAAPRSANFLTNDFLTPALGVGLYVDLPLHAFAFLPRGWRPNDRAAALEQAWEHFSHGVVDHAGTEPFRWSEGFVSTFSTRKPVWPILALNGTSVEKGKRIVVSNVDFACSGLSSEIARYDGMAVLGSDIAISTAVTMSARFPVISPTGGMRVNDTVQMRVTDGGLFENFGAVTADEVLRYVVERRGDVQRAERPVVPVAILISSDPSLDPLDRATLTGIVADRVVSRPVCDAPDPFPAHPGNNWPECPVAGRATATILADPLLSLYDGRVARGEMAAVSLLDRITANRVSVRDGLRDRLMRNTEKARTEAGEDLQGYRHALNRSFHDVQRRLGTRHHIDFFHFRQCRLIKQKTPTMSWHDSPEAWTAMQVMIGLEPGSGDECGNGAEFFRLCVRLARLTGDSATDEAATERCAGRWPKPNGWTCEMFEGESLCLMKPAGG
ncbi:MAG TPA: patatin-like phospholipase family protein, partial [Reyranellaceae bacterium]|nr:patatin-like phospholipase family protein [Reyranellaceae bacterium]